MKTMKVYYANGHVYCFWFESRWPGHAYFLKATVREWLEGDFE